MCIVCDGNYSLRPGNDGFSLVEDVQHKMELPPNAESKGDTQLHGGKVNAFWQISPIFIILSY